MRRFPNNPGPDFPLSTRSFLPARRGTNARSGAFHGGPSPDALKRARAGDKDFDPSVFVNPFINRHVPSLWFALVPEFGRQATYWIDGDAAQQTDIWIIWKEGREDEQYSPGRYSHALIQNTDLPRAPLKGDIMSTPDAIYNVVRVDALPYNYSNIVLQDSTETF